MRKYANAFNLQLLRHTHVYYVEITTNLFEVKKDEFASNANGVFVSGDKVANTLNSRRKVVIERMDGTLVSTFKLDDKLDERGFEL